VTINLPSKNSPKYLIAFVALMAILLTSCQRSGSGRLEYGYVAAGQVTLRDRVAPVFDKTGTVSNGERLQILERSRNGRFLRVRSPRDEEGWLEQRYVTTQSTFDTFQKLAAENVGWPVQGHASTRASLNMHVEPRRESPHLYQLKEGEKVELLKRTTSEKLAAKPAELDDEAPAPPGSVLEDWWLVRDSAQHTGWVLSRIIDIEAPIEVAQYAEGQRIIGCFVLDHVEDAGTRVPHYLMLLNEPKDGNPTDFNQIRVFTWIPKRHRYETAYRERKVAGILPVRTGFEDFGKEGKLAVFTVQLKDASGNLRPVTYKLSGVMVSKIVSAGQPAVAAASGKPPEAPKSAASSSLSGPRE
jgi:uncharacterized protein YgiM (DUF1202 family)